MARAGLIERLRTANDSAVAGKDVSAQSERLGNDAAQLWRTLIESSDKVKVSDGQLVRVVIVGSLAGGMSGALFDIAYLARLAAKKVIAPNGTVTVEGYLATPGAFDRASVGQNSTRLQVNAAAAARELERFQLSEGFPFPMPYTASMQNSDTLANAEGTAQEAQMPLNGVCDWMLFDHVTLFGGEGNPDRSSGKSDQPWATVFASMADVIGLRMDGATNAGAAGDYRAGLRNDIATRQASQGKAFVSTAGSFVYRLPLLDIMEIALAQWARKLFHAAVNGSDTPDSTNKPTTGPAGFDIAEPGGPASAEQSAQSFVSGAFDAQGAPPGMRAVGALATGGSLQTQDVLDLAAGGSMDGFAAENGSGSFERYLTNTLDMVLNGSRTETEPSHRTSRLSHAIVFLSNVQTQLATAIANAQTQRQTAPESAGSGSILQRLSRTTQASKPDWDAVIARTQHWADVVKQSAASLEAVRARLSGAITEVGQRDGQPSRSVMAELEARQARAEQRRKQMDQVAVRRYVWTRARSTDADPSDATNQVEIVDDILRQADEKLPEYLKRFYWRVQPDGSVQLDLVASGEKPIRLTLNDPKSAQKIADEVSRLATHVVQTTAKRLALHDALATQLPKSSDPAVALVEHAWRWAQPYLAYSRNVNGDLDGRRLAAAGVPVGMQQQPDLGEVANVVRAIGTSANRINLRYEPCPTTLISATDRTAFTLVREFTLMPLFNLPEMQRTWEVYRRNAGTEVEPTTEGAILATVFAAERTALEFERRLESVDPTVVNVDFHALHPLIVLALARPDRAELYACAFAAGWVTQTAEVAQLALPDGRTFRLDLRGRATMTAGLDWRVAGLLRFAAGDSADEPAAQALRSAFADAKAAPRQAWQMYLRTFRNPNGPYPFEGESQAVRDLAEVAALAAYRRLVPPESREERWNRMTMRRARKA
jgi:hypothetical protein